jgi:hypothetical protein
MKIRPFLSGASACRATLAQLSFYILGPDDQVAVPVLHCAETSSRSLRSDLRGNRF